MVGFERAPSMKDRSSLPYTAATVAEMLRSRPVAAISMRGANADVKVTLPFSNLRIKVLGFCVRPDINTDATFI